MSKILHYTYLALGVLVIGVLAFAIHNTIKSIISKSADKIVDTEINLSVVDMTRSLINDIPQETPEGLSAEIKNMESESRDSINLKFTFAGSLFLNGDDDGKREAIEMLRGFAEDELTLPVTRALATHLLVWAGSGYIHGGYLNNEFPFYIKSPQISAFDDEYDLILEEVLDASNSGYVQARYSLLRKLAEYSRDQYPVADNLMYLANIQSNLLLDLPYRIKESNDTKEDLLKKLNKYIEEADVQKEDDLQYDYGQNNAANASYRYWKGAVLGDATVAGYTPDQSFERSFDEALKIIETQGDLKNNLYGNYESLTHLNYAMYLNAIHGQDRRSDVEAHVMKLMKLLENKEIDNSNFDSYLSSIRNIKEREGYSHKYEYVVHIADISGELRKYLVSKGWSL